MDDKFSERRFIKLENVTNDVISSLSNVFAGSSSIFSSSRGDAKFRNQKVGHRRREFRKVSAIHHGEREALLHDIVW